MDRPDLGSAPEWMRRLQQTPRKRACRHSGTGLTPNVTDMLASAFARAGRRARRT